MWCKGLDFKVAGAPRFEFGSPCTPRSNSYRLSNEPAVPSCPMRGRAAQDPSADIAANVSTTVPVVPDLAQSGMTERLSNGR